MPLSRKGNRKAVDGYILALCDELTHNLVSLVFCEVVEKIVGKVLTVFIRLADLGVYC